MDEVTAAGLRPIFTAFPFGARLRATADVLDINLKLFFAQYFEDTLGGVGLVERVEMDTRRAAA